jgi:positive regulator of sigma E activity
VNEHDLALRSGRVVERAAAGYWVTIEAQRCADCKGGCAVAVGAERRILIDHATVWPPGRVLHPGALVQVAVSRPQFTRAVLRTFGGPLIGLAAGATVAASPFAAGSEAAVALWMLLGAGAGALGAATFGRRRGSRLRLQLFSDPDRACSAMAPAANENR